MNGFPVLCRVLFSFVCIVVYFLSLCYMQNSNFILPTFNSTLVANLNKKKRGNFRLENKRYLAQIHCKFMHFDSQAFSRLFIPPSYLKCISLSIKQIKFDARASSAHLHNSKANLIV
jgi:hypothetical protein